MLIHQLASSQRPDLQLMAGQKQVLDSVFDAENYTKALELTESHIRQYKKWNIHDSLYLYVYKVGRCYWKLKDVETGYRNAQNLMNHVMAFDRDTLHHLVMLNDMSWFYYETGNDSLCLQTDELFLEVCRKFSKTPLEKFADGYYNLGFDYLAVGRTIEAEESWTKALDMMQKNPDTKPSTLIKCYNALGTAKYRKGDFDQARFYYNQCIQQAAAIENKHESYSNTANAYGNLSLMADDEGNQILAKQMVEKCMRYRKLAMELANEPQLRQQEQDNLIKTYGNLATIYLSIGEVKKCEQLLDILKIEKEKLLEVNDPRRNLVHEQYAALYLTTNEPRKALEHILLYKESCALHYGPGSFWTGFSLLREAEIRHELGELAIAKDLFSQAIDLFAKLEDEDAGKELASAYRKRSAVLEDLGDVSGSIADLLTALNIYKASRHAFDPKITDCYLKLAEVKLNHGDLDGASQDVDEALRISEEYRLQLHAEQGRLSNFIPHLPEVYYTKARIAEKSSSPEALQTAYNNILKAVEYAKSAEAALDTDESTLLHYQTHEKIFGMAQEVSHRMLDQTGDKIHAEKLLQLGEENRTVMLRRQLSSFTALPYGQIPDTILKQEFALQQKLRKGEVEANDIHELIDDENQYDKLVEKIKQDYPNYYALKYNSSVASVDRIQRDLLKNGSSLIEYVITENALFVVVVNTDSFYALKLNNDELSQTIGKYNEAILAGRISDLNRLSYQLYRQLFEPVIPYLKSSVLYIIPDKALFNLNFETLRSSEGAGEDNFLIQKFTISYLLSATTALQFDQLKRSNAKGLIAMAPGFSDDLKQDYTNHKASFTLFDADFLQRIQQPFAVSTAKHIADMFNGKAFVGSSATEANFRSQASNYGIVHFGTHTEINNLSPMMSRLILNPAYNDSTDENDGYLHAYEIYNLQLGAELAVLTACETGIGKQENGEGVMSLAHSFAYAGCPSVVMSVWQIDEKTSAEIIEHFYDNLSSGMPKNEALREAKLLYMKEHPGELSAPYYWAGMVLLGDTQPINSASSFPWFWVIAGFGLATILFIFWKVLKRRR